ncbi:hypothetical protein AAFC00_000258 [Neodothiora populina]|uniref:F1-ATP synthase assembly protein n=1 Tax=Neodothiora populina TaxID=2781224 RepID=A0ABR3PCD1_9PEZI
MERILRPTWSASSLGARRICAQPPRSTLCAYRQLHNSPSRTATPVPHPTVPGPPPQPPKNSAEEKLARKRKQMEMLQKGKELRVDPKKPSSALRKRFWKQVDVQETPEGLRVMLDSRPVRLASKQVLTLPPSKRALAAAIALEWDLLVSAHQALKNHYIPLTSLTSRAIDIAVEDGEGKTGIRDALSAMLLRYLRTDTLLCWAPESSIHDSKQDKDAPSLRQKQKDVAEPIIAYLTTHIFPGCEIHPVLGEDSILPTPQPQMTQNVIRGWISGLPAFELAALERGVLASKSLLVAIRLLVEWSEEFKHLQSTQQGAERFGIAQAAEASTVEVTWQTNMWGEVEDTHDVEKQDLARQLGSVILLVN